MSATNLNRQLDALRARLAARYGERVSAIELDGVLEQVLPPLLAAPVQDYVPVLGERAARLLLDARLTAPASSATAGSAATASAAA